MSHLLNAGHPHARHYPLGMLWSEVRIVRQREGDALKREMVVLQMAIASNFSKKAGKAFEKVLNKVTSSD